MPIQSPVVRTQFQANQRVGGADMSREQAATLTQISDAIVAQQGVFDALPLQNPLSVVANGTAQITLGGAYQKVLSQGVWCDDCVPVTLTVPPNTTLGGQRIDLICVQPAQQVVGTEQTAFLPPGGTIQTNPTNLFTQGIAAQYVPGTTIGVQPPTPPGWTLLATVTLPASATTVSQGEVAVVLMTMTGQGVPGPAGAGVTTTTLPTSVPQYGGSVTLALLNGTGFPVGAVAVVSDGNNAFALQVTNNAGNAVTGKCVGVIMGAVGNGVNPNAVVTFGGFIGVDVFLASSFGVIGNGVDDDRTAWQNAISFTQNVNGTILCDAGLGSANGPGQHLYRISQNPIPYTDSKTSQRLDFAQIPYGLLVTAHLTIMGWSARVPNSGPAFVLDDYSYDGILVVNVGAGPSFARFSIGTTTTTDGDLPPAGTTVAGMHFWRCQGVRLEDINFGYGNGCYNGLWVDSSGGVTGSDLNCPAANLSAIPAIPRWCYRVSGANPGNANDTKFVRAQASQAGATNYANNYVTGFLFDSGYNSWGLNDSGSLGGLGRGYWLTTSGVVPTSTTAPGFGVWSHIGSDHNDRALVFDAAAGNMIVDKLTITSSNTDNVTITGNATSGALTLSAFRIESGGNGYGGIVMQAGAAIDLTLTNGQIDKIGDPSDGVALAGAGNVIITNLKTGSLTNGIHVLASFSGFLKVSGWRDYSRTSGITIDAGCSGTVSIDPSLYAIASGYTAVVNNGMATWQPQSAIKPGPGYNPGYIAGAALPTPTYPTGVLNNSGLTLLVTISGASHLTLNGVTLPFTNGTLVWLPGANLATDGTIASAFAM